MIDVLMNDFFRNIQMQLEFEKNISTWKLHKATIFYVDGKLL